jgi:hypothetical protein
MVRPGFNEHNHQAYTISGRKKLCQCGRYCVDGLLHKDIFETETETLVFHYMAIPILRSILQYTWVTHEATSISYDSYCALRGYNRAPLPKKEDCPDVEKWRIETGRLYLYMCSFAFGRRPFSTENGYLGMGPEYL